MKYIIILILIVGGCIYAEGSVKNGNVSGPSRIAEVQSRELKSTTTKSILPKQIKSKSTDRSSIRLRNRDSSSNVKYTTFVVTAYTKNDAGMNGRGITASGKKARHMVTVASRGMKMGTRIYLVELDRIVVVEDRFGVHKASNRLDLFVNDKALAMKIGKRKMKGVILK